MSAQSSGDLGRLKEAANKHMIRYVTAFAPYFGMKAKGTYIYDDQGREILDFCSGQMCATLGHNHPAVTEAIEKSCEDVVHLFSGLLSPPVVRLAEELGAILPPGLQKMMFMSTGSEFERGRRSHGQAKIRRLRGDRAYGLVARHHCRGILQHVQRWPQRLRAGGSRQHGDPRAQLLPLPHQALPRQV